MFEEVSADDAAMSEIRTAVAIKIASATNIALTVIKVASLPHIVAIMPCKLPALVASNVAMLLIEERAALRPLGEIRAA